jgi:hypothetical protein
LKAAERKKKMRSTWIEYKGKKIFYQNFAGHFFNYEAVKDELDEVQKVVISQPKNSVLVLADFTDTAIAGDLMQALNASSTLTKDFVKRTAVLGVTGIKKRLAEILTKLTGQELKHFESEAEAKNWLVQED